MYFEGQEVTPYQNPVKASVLKEGDIFYFVGTGDDNRPSIDSVYFIGRNLEIDDSNTDELFYFQDSRSYYAGIRYESYDPKSPFPAWFFAMKADGLKGLYDLESALQILMFYYLKQKKVSA